jgi:hypothetical protein
VVLVTFLGGWYSICRKAKYPARVNSGRAQPVYPGSSPGRNAKKDDADPFIVVGVDSMAKESTDDDEIVSASCHVHNNEDDDDDDDFVDGTKVFFHVKDIIIS